MKTILRNLLSVLRRFKMATFKCIRTICGFFRFHLDYDASGL